MCRYLERYLGIRIICENVSHYIVDYSTFQKKEGLLQRQIYE